MISQIYLQAKLACLFPSVKECAPNWQVALYFSPKEQLLEKNEKKDIQQME